jgi:hypothetical protein
LEPKRQQLRVGCGDEARGHRDLFLSAFPELRYLLDLGLRIP